MGSGEGGIMDHAAIIECLRSFLKGELTEQAFSWLEERSKGIAQTECDEKKRQRSLFMTFSACTRYTEKKALQLTDHEIARADSVRSDWNPSQWRWDHAARVFVLLHWPAKSADSFTVILDKIFAAADLGELEALYLALPLLPFPNAHHKRCAEGLRTNMTSVFTSIAHNNPYPKEQLNEAAWNQMVLKALFVGEPLHPIDGLDDRANATLSQMLCDYAHERWAAGRKVSPELWRPVAIEPNAQAISDLNRALGGEDRLGACGAALALKPTFHTIDTELKAQCQELLTESTCWTELASQI
jgi:hypothetical protein